MNANDTPGAWCFTLVHELAHLWIGATGVSGGTAGRAIEKFCNDVASELLLPKVEIEALAITEATSFHESMAKITEFAIKRNVSSTMVAYKLYRSGAFGFERFQQLKAAYRKAFLDWKAAKGSATPRKTVAQAITLCVSIAWERPSFALLNE